jgi:hypothetical protein
VRRWCEVQINKGLDPNEAWSHSPRLKPWERDQHYKEKRPSGY